MCLGTLPFTSTKQATRHANAKCAVGLISGMIAGAAIGAAIGILFAPKTGAETRQELKEKGGDLAGTVKDKAVRVADTVKDKVIEGISDIRDESDRNGMRIVIELKRDANPQVVLNRLFSQTSMQSSFSINMLALVNNQTQPKILSLRNILDE